MTCIITPYAKNPQGYGSQWHEGKRRYTHRVAYVKHHGLAHADIDGLHVRHTCDTPSCVNPDHLLIGTNQDNMDDKVARGRQFKPDWKDHHAAKLDFDTAQQIKALEGTCTQRELPVKFGVSQRTINKILRGKTYVTP